METDEEGALMRPADGDVVVGAPDPRSSEESGDDSGSGSSGDDSGSGSDARVGDESESGSELELALAEDGRVACPLLPHLTLDAFSAFPNAFALDDEDARRALLADCDEAFTARATTKARGPYSSGRTYWLAADAEPRCALEQLAKRVFEAHTRAPSAAFAAEKKRRGDCGDTPTGSDARGFDPRRSGAEWWTQVVDVDDEIGMHWDKDYALEAADVNVHPQIGTVTYFSSAGAPTLMARKRAGTFFRDASFAGAFDDFETDPQSMSAFHAKKPKHTSAEAFLSFPAFGKHVAFDGRWLHGALPELGGTTSGEAKATKKKAKRVTFLVNVWLNHVPSTATPLPKKTLSRVAPIGAYALERDIDGRFDDTDAPDGSVEVVDVAKTGGATRAIERAFAHADATFRVRAALPKAWFAGGAPGRGGSFALVGTGGEVVETQGSEKKKRKR